MPVPPQLRQTYRGKLAAAPSDDAPSSLFLRVNGEDRSIPMRSRLPAFGSLRAAAELVLATGGLEVKRLRSSALTARIGLDRCTEALRVERRVSALAGDLLQMGMDASDNEGTPPCCIPRIRVHDHGAAGVVVDLYVERSDARGMAFLETAARAVLPLLQRLADCQTAATLQFLSTPVDQISVNGGIDIEELIDTVIRAAGAPDGPSAMSSCLDERVRRFCSGSHQPELAARHNDHVLATVSAAFERYFNTGRFVLEARGHAARWGSCEPLANWRQRGRELLGQLQLPLLFDSRGIASPTALGERLPGAPVVDLACVAFAASLGFLQQELLAQAPPGRPRPRLPPPLPADGRLRRPPAGDTEKRNSESGVRLAIRDSDIPRVRTGSGSH